MKVQNTGSLSFYQAPTEETALEELERTSEKWSEKYPDSMKSWGQVYGELSIMYEGRLLG